MGVKQRFDSLSRIQQNLCHSEKRTQFFESIKKSIHFKKKSDFRDSRFNSLSQKIMKIFQFFESSSKKGSILWVMWKKVQFLWVMSFQKKKSSILWVIKIILYNLIFSENQFFESSFFQKKKVISIRHIWKRKVKSSSHLWKEGSILYVLWVIFFDKTILWVIITQKSFCESCSKKGSILWVILKRRVQCFESYSIIWVKLKNNPRF